MLLPSGRVDNLDLVRAGAILLVLVFHAVQIATGSGGIATSGQFGVDLFFVLSGYLIGRLYWNEHRRFGSVERLRFIARRALRTVPPYLAALALSYGAVRLGRGDPFDARYLAFTQNYEPRMPFFLVSWSLAVEEHFYLALPFVLGVTLLWNRRYVPAVLGLALAVSLVSRATSTFPITATHLRLDGLAIGVLAAYVATYHPAHFAHLARLRWLALVLVVLALTTLLLLPAGFVLVWGYALLALIFGLTVSVAATDRPWRWAQWRATRFVAITSYSVYLTHPLVNQVVVRVGRAIHLPTLVIMALMIGGAFAVGYVFYGTVELRAIRMRDHLVPRRAVQHSEADERHQPLNQSASAPSPARSPS